MSLSFPHNTRSRLGRTASTRAAESRKQQERRVTTCRCENPFVNRNPEIAGPRKEPTAFTELMKPTDAAAADSPRIRLGMTQNDTPHEKAAAPVRQSKGNTTANGNPGMALSRKNPPASTMGTAVCNLRFPVRSEDRPTKGMVIIARANGSAEHIVDSVTESPEALRIVVGNQSRYANIEKLANAHDKANSKTLR